MKTTRSQFFLVLSLIGLLTIVTFSLSGRNVIAAEETWTKPISIASGSIGSSHYVVMSGIAAVITKYANITATVEATQWSAANVDLLRDKEVEVASCTSDAVYDAWNGYDYFKDRPQRFLRLIHSGYTSCGAIVAREDSGIQKPSDLKGKRFYAWMPTSPIYMRWCNLTLEANHLSKTDLNLMNVVSTKEAVQALVDNRADAAIIVGSIPTAAIIELTNTIPCRIISLTEREISLMNSKYPFVFPLTLPAHTYKGQDKEMTIFGVKTHIVTNAELPNDLIYRVIKSIMEHPNEVVGIHPAAKTVILKDFFVKPQAPFHPGAIKYYKEAGVWTPEIQKVQDAFFEAKK
jgi:TRAP transporter TAXI family solute receptor